MNDVDTGKMEDELVELLRTALSMADRLRKVEVGICLDRALCHLGLPPVGPQDGMWFDTDPSPTSDLATDHPLREPVGNRPPHVS